MTQSIAKDDEWRKGWILVVATSLASGISAFHTQSIGSVMKTLTDEFGWSRTEIVAGPFIISLVGIFAKPALGFLIDRVGPRRIGLISPWVFGLGLALIGQTGPSIWTWYLAFVFIAIVSPAVTGLVWSSAVVSRFNKNRGMALGVVISGVALLGGVVPVFMTWAISTFGWRTAYAMLGGAAIAISYPLVYLFFYHVSDLRRRGMDHKIPSFAAKTADRQQQPGMTLPEVLRSSRYWRMLVALMIAGGVSGFFIVHLQPLLMDAGVSAPVAALAVSLIAPIIVVARILGGFLLDRLFAPYFVAAILIMPIIACALLAILPVSAALGFAVAVLIGFSMGAEGDALPFLTSKYFGQRNFSAIYGFLLSAFALGYGGGPMIGAMIFDAMGSYTPLMAFACGALAIAAALMLTIGRYPDFAERPTDATRDGASEIDGRSGQPSTPAT